MILYHTGIEENARTHPQKIAVFFEECFITYGDLLHLANITAKNLTKLGIRPGDRVALYANSSIETVISAIGILISGGVITTIHQSFDFRKLKLQLLRSNSKILITDNYSAGLAAQEENLIDSTIALNLLEEIKLPPKVLKLRDFSDIENMSPPNLNTEDLGAIFYTSGSSGTPKGAAVTHRAMLAAYAAVRSCLPFDSKDVILSYSSLTSDYGFHNAMMPLLAGATVVLRSRPPHNPDDLFQTINRHKVTGMHVFPPIIFTICKADTKQQWEVPTLKYISTSGQLLPEHSIRTIQTCAPTVDIYSNYGLTECKRVSCLPPSEIKNRPSSVGKPVAGVRIFILDDNNEPHTSTECTGQLAVAADMMMQGYWGMALETAQKIKSTNYCQDKVLLTGDIFRRDQDGYLYYLCREDDCFVRNTFNVNPREIEKVLLQHPLVAEAMVFPIPDESAGHVPKAIIVLVHEMHKATDTLLDYCKAHLDWHDIPVSIDCVTALPTGHTGKTRAPFIETH